MIETRPLTKKELTAFKRAEKALDKLKNRLVIEFENHLPKGFNYDKPTDCPSEQEMQGLCELLRWTRGLIK